MKRAVAASLLCAAAASLVARTAATRVAAGAAPPEDVAVAGHEHVAADRQQRAHGDATVASRGRRRQVEPERHASAAAHHAEAALHGDAASPGDKTARALQCVEQEGHMDQGCRELVLSVCSPPGHRGAAMRGPRAGPPPAAPAAPPAFCARLHLEGASALGSAAARGAAELAAAPASAPASAPAAAPASAPAGPFFGTKAVRALPEQGFSGARVEHGEKTATADWQEEFGPAAGHRSFVEICADFPENEWCRLHMYDAKGRRWRSGASAPRAGGALAAAHAAALIIAWRL